MLSFLTPLPKTYNVRFGPVSSRVDAARNDGGPGIMRRNSERMRANVIEAAEQCGILSLAEVAEPVALDRYLAQRAPTRLLVFCDEAADAAEAARLFSALAEGGKVIMPQSQTFFSPRFGMVADKFGVHWMVIVPQPMS